MRSGLLAFAIVACGGASRLPAALDGIPVHPSAELRLLGTADGQTTAAFHLRGVPPEEALEWWRAEATRTGWRVAGEDAGLMATRGGKAVHVSAAWSSPERKRSVVSVRTGSGPSAPDAP